ncbi:hypothetical protein ALC57_10573 [Trachymyrmex cornetzi]|uniref:Uncharacterized protein n=1 Tax=Trachymyrmex cornetzi TaxID=471704 RepID=A0A151J405_9HYME|nr:hypothetical protein ALC57_10573 [Trachymyrmex cornetzi]
MRAFPRRNLRGDEMQLRAYLARVQRRYYKGSAINYESVDLSFQVRSTCHSALLHSQKRLFQANAYVFYMRMDR